MDKRILENLGKSLEGEFYYDELIKTLYATDASAYKEMPLAVAIPKTEEDIKKLIVFASENDTSIIPRTAGTSLAGQVVGAGIVVDVSKNFRKILEVDKEEGWVKVQPGVIRDDLNKHLMDYGLFFGPETSTANRAMIGGMIGNNSCGSNSIVYGSTRDHLIEVKGFLSDGSEVVFKPLSNEDFKEKCEGKNVVSDLEANIYRTVAEILGSNENREEIKKEFPKPAITRRNTGYAIDMLAQTAPFEKDEKAFNFCQLIAGSEGTLFFLTEAKLHVNPRPPKNKALVCVHCESVDESLRANLIGLKHNPSASELMDHFVLECTKSNIEHKQNRFFVQGDPQAILVIELSEEDATKLDKRVTALVDELKIEALGYAYPVVKGDDIKRVWSLRKAGLGLLSNMPGDAKPAPVIEDTAVAVTDLPDYIRHFNVILEKYSLSCVHYAHAGSGELHLRPILNLKTKDGNRLFKTIADEIAVLVKKYKGSLSGEHGDGRLRGEYIKFMVGDHNYELLKSIKHTWDPKNIFNPGKIVDTPAMNESLRYKAGQKTPEIPTYFDFSENQGVLRAAEMCNGSGDCRKSELSGSTMCPSFMATGNEKDSTRARANILREILTHSEKENPFDSPQIKEVMDLCISCKGCKSECPSNVDMAKLKGEFLQNYYDEHGVPKRAKLIGNFSKYASMASKAPGLYNFFNANPLTSKIIKKRMGFAQERPIPKMYKTTFRNWFKKEFQTDVLPKDVIGTVAIFCDEFTNYNDTEIGIKTVKLLDHLGYQIIMFEHEESGRAFFSKGMLEEAKKVVDKNVEKLAPHISKKLPLVGIEPSAILSFRDEYFSICEDHLIDKAKRLAKHCYTIDEFLANEVDKGNIKPGQFIQEKKTVKMHGHCHQKALSSMVPMKKILSLPLNYTVHNIPSGCCGMAGSFGYEEEHYHVSMKIGELVLFPTVRKQSDDVIIAAPGTSCRHQIHDGTGRKALHPVEILYNALREK